MFKEVGGGRREWRDGIEFDPGNRAKLRAVTDYVLQDITENLQAGAHIIAYSPAVAGR